MQPAKQRFYVAVTSVEGTSCGTLTAYSLQHLYEVIQRYCAYWGYTWVRYSIALSTGAVVRGVTFPLPAATAV